MRRRHRSRKQGPADLNVTTFMNLMVALVPFLLVMAVFSNVAILELKLPRGQSGGEEDSKALNLEVVVRHDRLELHGGGGLIAQLPNTAGGHDLGALAERLVQVKARFPDTTSATLLLEPEIPYEQLVGVMDAVRVTQVEQAGERVPAELFPDLSIGDAPGGGS